VLVSRASTRQSSFPPASPIRIFPLAWPRWQPPPRDGVAAIVGPGAPITWADGLLAREDRRLVVWATATDPEQQGLNLLGQPGVQAAALATGRPDPRRVRLALEVAIDLAARREGGPAAGACLTSWSLPAPPAGVVRIPHLITIGYSGGATDTVVWELAPTGLARSWLGGPLPDLSYFEARLDALLRLRGAARRGQLPGTAVSAGLAELLPDRDLSIRQVYGHPDLFRALLGA
jgi:hypothetical protein